PDLNGQMLEVGRTYTLVATPAPGSLFASWSGAANSSLPRLTFVMTPDLALEVRFIPNPFPAVAGRYNGLFSEADDVRLESSGFFSALTTARGTFAGSLQTGGARLPFSGKFDVDGHATNVVRRRGAAPLTLELSLDLANGSDQIQGRVTDGAWVARLVADKAISKANATAVPFAGAYTLDLPPDAADPSGPGGDSIAAVTVDASGNVRLAGTLADGTRLARAVPLSKDGLWPLYASLYTGKGVVLGWLMFTNGSDADLSGRVSWIKQPLAPGRFYPNGFTSESLAVGSTYHPPNSATSGIVTFTNGVVALRGGDI